MCVLVPCLCRRIIDIAPPPNSTVAPTHMAQYQALGDWLRGCYGTVVGNGSFAAGANSVVLDFGSPVTFDRVALREDQSAGQLIRLYQVQGMVSSGGSWSLLSTGQSVGAQKIDVLGAPFTGRYLQVTTDAVPTGLTLAVYNCTTPS